MANRKKELPTFEQVTVLSAGAEGKAVARVNERVVFLPFAAPGDVVDIRIKKKRKNYMNGEVIKFHSYSDQRVTPKCEHFGICGGCKWQHLHYSHQLQFKQQQVIDQLQRLGRFEMPRPEPILGSANQYYYRNKLEYTFSNKRWLTDYSREVDFQERDMDGLGFHMPGMYDRVLDIQACHLQKDPSNKLRLAVKEYAKGMGLSFYDVKNWSGFLRNLIIRTANTGDLMVILVVNYADQIQIDNLLTRLANDFPEITSLMYVVNTKKNAVITDLEVKLFQGLPYIREKMENLTYKVGPVSFFQTNSEQAYALYKIVREYASFKGDEIVYDLYTGTGTIANFVASEVQKVIGIEYIESAVNDARENAQLNEIGNALFFAGDMAEILTKEFAEKNGDPDVVITDPPRAGMHESVVRQLLELNPATIVYVSCNPATQARDVTLLSDKYRVVKVQPVDMFPHTHHVENVIKLVRT